VCGAHFVIEMWKNDFSLQPPPKQTDKGYVCRWVGFMSTELLRKYEGILMKFVEGLVTI